MNALQWMDGYSCNCTAQLTAVVSGCEDLHVCSCTRSTALSSTAATDSTIAAPVLAPAAFATAPSPRCALLAQYTNATFHLCPAAAAKGAAPPAASKPATATVAEDDSDDDEDPIGGARDDDADSSDLPTDSSDGERDTADKPDKRRKRSRSVGGADSPGKKGAGFGAAGAGFLSRIKAAASKAASPIKDGVGGHRRSRSAGGALDGAAAAGRKPGEPKPKPPPGVGFWSGIKAEFGFGAGKKGPGGKKKKKKTVILAGIEVEVTDDEAADEDGVASSDAGSDSEVVGTAAAKKKVRARSQLPHVSARRCCLVNCSCIQPLRLIAPRRKCLW